MRLTPIFTVLGLIALLFFIVWGFNRFGDQVSASVSNLIAAVQVRVAPAATPTATRTPLAAVPNVANGANNGTPAGNTEIASGGTPVASSGVIISTAPTRTVEIILKPTDTPALAAVSAVTTTVGEEPTPPDTPTPTASPTNTTAPTVGAPTETPTETPTATPAPVVAAAQCPDPRAVLTSPGVNQTLSGVVQVTGRAVHDSFDYYKLEFAPAGGGFTYFAGEHNAVDGGLLGSFDTTALPNGAYTLQLTVVDKSANYPSPCQVSVIVQN